MALSSSPDCLFQPEDKALRTLCPSIEDPSSTFDEYLNGDIYDPDEQEDNKTLSEALAEYLDGKPSIHSNGRLSPIGGPARREKSSPQPWRKGLWCMNQNISKLPEIKIAKRRNNNLQNPNWPPGNSGNGTFLDPRSPPATPSSKGTKGIPISPRTAKFSQSPYARKSVSKEATLSPTPLYAQMRHRKGMAQHDTWQEDFRDFRLQPAYEALSLSPPLSGRTPQQQHAANLFAASMMAQKSAAVQHQEHLIAYPGVQLMHSVEQNYSAVDPTILNQADYAQGVPHQSQGLLASPLSQSQVYHGLPDLSAEILHSDESQNSWERHQDIGNPTQAQQWYSPALSPGGTIQHPYAQQFYYPIILAPTPSRPTHHLVQPPAVQTQGLGIHYPPSSALSPSTTCHPEPLSMHSYPPLPPLPTYAFTNEDPFSKPHSFRLSHRRQSSPLRASSSSVSPTKPRNLRQRSPTHSRRKSIHKPGPIATTSCSAKDLPPMPRTPTHGFEVMDFVNFTPKDSAKLLSDVAPSGSSKTRARREQEAKERRKRLSEAAIKAVRRAGGDVRVLKAEGVCLT